jgi:hypothetical protein
MADMLPRVVGLAELLRLEKPLREKPAPVVYFTDREFARLLKGVVELKRVPPGAIGMPAFLPWPGGGVVQQSCTSPPGQVCIGQWIPAGPTHGSGVYFGCDCKVIGDGPKPPPPTCRVLLDGERFRCIGECKEGGRACQLGFWRDSKTGMYTLSCRCRPLRLSTD